MTEQRDSVDELVERIEDAVDTLWGNGDIRFGNESDRAKVDLIAALSDLAARLRSAERERDAARLSPPLVRSTLEKALRTDMTQPPVTQGELRAAIDMLPPSPSFYSSVLGMEQLSQAEAEAQRLRGELASADRVIGRMAHVLQPADGETLPHAADRLRERVEELEPVLRELLTADPNEPLTPSFYEWVRRLAEGRTP